VKGPDGRFGRGRSRDREGHPGGTGAPRDGLLGPEKPLLQQLGVKLDERGNVWTDQTKMTSVRESSPPATCAGSVAGRVGDPRGPPRRAARRSVTFVRRHGAAALAAAAAGVITADRAAPRRWVLRAGRPGGEMLRPAEAFQREHMHSVAQARSAARRAVRARVAERGAPVAAQATPAGDRRAAAPASSAAGRALRAGRRGSPARCPRPRRRRPGGR